ncbi:LysR family transcriptional regulator [Cupriavidus necator]|uniref:LysR family transcriptional regulator n=1 Tax=Cupriavidus necator TaxID=106590 RepID=UPI003F73328C
MDFDVLRGFVTIAELGSLSRASAALGVAQSALSRQLSALESELGGRLFHRTGRGVTLTETGASMLPRARGLLSDAQAMVDEAANVMHSPSGLVSIGLVPAWSTPLSGQLVSWRRNNHPGIRLRIYEGYSGEIEEWLTNGRIDVGIFNRYRSVGQEEAILTSSMYLIARSDDLSIGDECKLKALSGLPLALMTRPNAFRMLLEENCNRDGVLLNLQLEADSAAAIKGAVLTGGLYSVLPLHSITVERQMGILRGIPIVDPCIKQSTLLQTTTHHPLTAATREVWRALPGLLKSIVDAL